MDKKYKHIYGPVSSWRLGSSLGVDAVSGGKDKACSFDCIYCQAGKTGVFSRERKIYVPTCAILEEIKMLPDVEIDYITFSGAGEPTLAKNLGDIISGIKNIRKEKIAVLTNASIIDRPDVQEDLALSDFVSAKLDAASQDIFDIMNKGAKGIKLKNIIRGLIEFNLTYGGKLSLQVMFAEENKNFARDIAELAEEINPDEIHINTPLRQCEVNPLSEKELGEIKEIFKNVLADTKGIDIITAYEGKKSVIGNSVNKTLRRKSE